MGLLRGKGTCSICQTNPGKEVKDGFVCKECLDACGKFLTNTGLIPRRRTIQDIKACQKQNEQFLQLQAERNACFTTTSSVYGIELDQKHQLFLPLPKDAIFAYDDLAGYQLMLNDHVIACNEATMSDTFAEYGRQALYEAQKEHKDASADEFCVELTMQLFVKQYHSPELRICIISTMTAISMNEFYQKLEVAQAMLDVLYELYQHLQAQPSLTAKNPQSTKEAAIALDPYEEMKKLKELLDLGIVTHEEFEQKKKQLLNL